MLRRPITIAGAVLLLCAASADARTTRFSMPVPSPGDVSYGVVQVNLGKKGKVPRRGRKVLAQTLAGMKVQARSKAWRKLRKSTKVYLVASPVRGGKATSRNLAVFVTRRKGGKTGPSKAKISLSIANGTPAVSSYWVRRASRKGNAKIFAVRNILTTAVGNWSRYIAVLTGARALQAAQEPVDVNGTFASRRPRQDGGGELVRGGMKMNAATEGIFRLLFGTIGNRAEYQTAKQSALIPAWITTDLRNPELAIRWADVASRVPLKVPDAYAAAAKTEAQFADVKAPRISPRQVQIADPDNSSDTAAVEAFAGKIVPGRGVVRVAATEGGGVVGGTEVNGVLYEFELSCPPLCVFSPLEGRTISLAAVPLDGYEFTGWFGCPAASGPGGTRCKLPPAAEDAQYDIGAVFVAKAGGPPAPGPVVSPSPEPSVEPAGPAPSDLDTGFGTGGFTMVPFARSIFANAVAAQPDGKLVVAGGIARADSGYDWFVARFTETGALDETFAPAASTPGLLVIDQSGAQGLENGATAVAITPTGNILVTGARDLQIDGDDDLVVREYTSTGAPSTFGAGDAGVSTVIVPDSKRTVSTGLFRQADGKIIVGGYYVGTADIPRVYVARLDSDGAPDTTFNDGSGLYVVPTGACGNCTTAGMFARPSVADVSTIYLAGATGFGQGVVFKIAPTSGDTNFAVDSGYGTSGGARITGTRLQRAQDLFAFPSGEVVTVGKTSDDQCGIVRLTDAGALDTTFGTGGSTTTALPQHCLANGLAFQDGKWVIAGETLETPPDPSGGVLGRFTADGAIDAAFPPAKVASGSTSAFFNDLLLQGTKPVVVGAGDPFPHKLQVARYRGG